MEQSNREAFNTVAGKMVSYREWQREKLALYNKELTTREKFILAFVDIPVSAAVGIGLDIKRMFNREAHKGLQCDGAKLDCYVSQAYISRFLAEASPFAVNKSLRNKTDALAMRAFDACEDYSEKIKKKPRSVSQL